jgi:poly(hydroxyalkanoate) depolymerase family esterase
LSLSIRRVLEAARLTAQSALNKTLNMMQSSLKLNRQPWQPPVQEPAPAPATPVQQPPVERETDTHTAIVNVTEVAPLRAARPASFTKHHYVVDGEPRVYRLFVPSLPASAEPPAAMPMVVMLHGCKQDAADFALGTAMNALAEQHQCLVLYPEQTAKANNLRCWNWFDVAHQGHGGEPAMLAALTRQVARRQGVNPSRIYIAGLSAGGAMAAVVAALYPEVFAAVGVHSGLPAGAASDVISAFKAMRHGASHRPALAQHKPSLMPTIVFHGRADQTVHPDNSDQIVAAALMTLQSCGLALQKAEHSPAARQVDRPASDTRDTLQTVYRTACGKSFLEYWSVNAGPHAWSGGSAAGSFTDPHGPNASRAMLAFFLQHSR